MAERGFLPSFPFLPFKAREALFPLVLPAIQQIVLNVNERRIIMTITRMDFVDTIERRIKEIYPHINISRKEIEKILELFIQGFIKNLTDGHRIELRGFGVFSTKMRKPKIARNPKTKEEVRLPPRRVPIFKASKNLKEMINQWR